MSFTNTGKVWDTKQFIAYLKKIKKPSYVKAIVLHHTAAPSLAQRPAGLTTEHIENIKSYYEKKLGWKSGPHLFIDDDQIFGMSPLESPGVHAVSFNKNSIGIEVLGDYDSEDPFKGRGLKCWTTAAETTKALLDWLSLPVNETTVLFHRDDPKTTKTCPGKLIKKDWILNLIREVDKPQPMPVPKPQPTPIPSKKQSVIVKFILGLFKK